MLRLLKRLWQDQCGQDLVEYVLLMIIVSLGVVASVRIVGQSVANSMTAASSNLMAHVPGSSGGQQSSVVAANSKAMGIKGRGIVTETETGMVMATATVGTGVMVKATKVREVVTTTVRKVQRPITMCRCVLPSVRRVQYALRILKIRGGSRAQTKSALEPVSCMGRTVHAVQLIYVYIQA